MFPIAFDPLNIVHTRLGLGKMVDVISLIVHEELNGEYSMEMEYPISGPLFSDLVAGATIGAVAPHYSAGVPIYRAMEMFDIYSHSTPIDGIVTFKGNHYSRRLANRVFPWSGFDASDYDWAWSRAYPASPGDGSIFYKRTTEMTGRVDTTYPKSSLATLIGEEESCVSELGGDIVFSCNSTSGGAFSADVLFLAHRGEDRGASIRFGVNMMDVDHETDNSKTYNAVVPFWDDGDGNITYASGYIVQPTTPISPIIAVPLDCSNDFEEQPTSAQLVTAAQNHLDSKKPWTGTETIKVDFVNGEEIDPHAPEIQLGDTVHVYWGDADIATDLRVVAYDYDVLAERYVSMELGTPESQFVAVTGGSTGSGKEPRPLSRYKALSATTPGAIGTAYTVSIPEAKGIDFVAIVSPSYGVVCLRSGYNSYPFVGGNEYWVGEGAFGWDKDTGTLTYSVLRKGSSRSWADMKPTVFFY